MLLFFSDYAPALNPEYYAWYLWYHSWSRLLAVPDYNFTLTLGYCAILACVKQVQPEGSTLQEVGN